jgi:hypothetical protein
MKTILRAFLFSLWFGMIGLWAPDATAQSGGLGPCTLPLQRSVLGLLPGGAAGHAAMIKRTMQCLQATGQAPAGGAPAGSGSFVTIDPPGSTLTIPSGITPDGTIAGYYCNTAACAQQFGFLGAHGFLRTPNGSFTTFDPSGSTETLPTSITAAGQIAGAYCDTAACARQHGYVRDRDGTFAIFDAPGVSSSLVAPIYNPGGPPPGITPAGTIAGTYFDASGEHGFLRAKNGALTTIDVPSASFTEGLGVNPSGSIIGDFCNQTTCFTGFIRTPDGSFSTINIPGACSEQTIPLDINPAGVVVGSVPDASCSVLHAYVRFPGGAITIFNGPGATYSEPLAINPAGAITGYFCSNACHGFLRTPDGVITAFDPPGSFFTQGTGINPSGAIIGAYQDANGVSHGFLRLP